MNENRTMQLINVPPKVHEALTEIARTHGHENLDTLYNEAIESLLLLFSKAVLLKENKPYHFATIEHLGNLSMTVGATISVVDAIKKTHDNPS